MRRKKNYLIGAAAVAVSAVLSGCCACGGATMKEAWYEKFTDDPLSVAIVQPNDTTLDPMAEHVQEKKNDWVISASVIPAEEARASLHSIGARWGTEQTRQYYISLGNMLANRFGELKNFKLVGTPAADASGITEIHSAAPNRLTYNLSQLSYQFHRGQWHPPVYINGNRISDGYKDPDYFVSTASVHVVLLDAAGNQRFSINAVGEARAATRENAANSAIAIAVNSIMNQYAFRYAPPGYVSMMRGDGLFAQINIGKNDGANIGMPVRFIQYINMGKIGGKDNIQENVIAAGRIVKISGDSAWVKVTCYHNKVVHIGTSAKLGR